MVKPCLSAASIDSWSRTDPPGWIIALIPLAAISSILSANGKKASEVVEESKIASATTLILVFCLLGGASASYVLELFVTISPSYPAQLVYAMMSLLLAMVVFIGQALLTYRRRATGK